MTGITVFVARLGCVAELRAVSPQWQKSNSSLSSLCTAGNVKTRSTRSRSGIPVSPLVVDLARE